MRITTLALFALTPCLSVSADETKSQKPLVAPTVERGATPQPPKVEVASIDWAKRFADGPTPLWVWGADAKKDYRIEKTFDAKGIKAARLVVTCDNRVTLYFNQKQVASSNEWQEPVEVDVTKLLKEKGNVIDARAGNEGGVAALALKLVLVPEKGEPTYIVTDESWTCSTEGSKAKENKPVKKIGTYGDGPWGKVFDASTAAQPGSKVPANTFVALPGFKVEKLFTVPRAALGSWVCLTADDKGRLIASDQDGKGLYRITPGKVGTEEETKIEKIPAKITAAQGLLWHKGALFVVCNGGPGSGLYRVTSSENDDQLDKVEKLKSIPGGGEHGPHAIRLAPDGKSLFIVCGNHTQPPEKIDHSRVPKNWSEDHLLTRMWDAGGHARGILAPGGYVVRTDFDGKSWEMFSTGYRNQYDFAFNADGEMFVYDSDMEWDMGMPWYRPTRVSHTVSGGEYGWRSGSGVWPAYYVDSLPAMIDIGPGSPVGVEFGYGAKFPAKYQKALFICDWTFGTMYAIHTEPNGSTYKATKEEFLSRTPLPLTDVVINQADGAMYFTVGGRGAQSELFRVTYVGKEPTEKVEYKTRPTAELKILKQIEEYHKLADDPVKAVEFLLPLLNYEDRFIRYSARVALEHQPVKFWQDKVLVGNSSWGTINGIVALAHQGDKALQPQLLAALDRFALLTDEDVQKFGVPAPALGRFLAGSEDELLGLLRAYQVVFTRTGEPNKDAAAALVKKLDRLFPAKSDSVNRELVQLLIYLKSPTVVEKLCTELKKPSKPFTQEGLDEVLLRNRGYGGTVANMLKNAPDQQKLAYLFALRNATVGWNMDRWKTYYGFLTEARAKAGGASYQGFLTNIEKEAFANATDSDRLAIEAGGLRPAYKVPTLPKPIGPGRAWATADVVALGDKLKSGRDFKNGARAFAAARCVVCHRFGGEGGATGPDLSQVAGRFGLKDLVESITEPSKVISDQYKASVIQTTDDKTITGKIVNDAGGKYTVVLDPENSSKVLELKKEDVASVKASNISLMPEKLLNELNEREVLDMLAYLLSRGDPNHAMFKK